jgi:LuxR family transcriptional regulator, maltose regulon positive regulatory protein
MYRAEGDLLGAARVATALAIDYVDYRGDFAVASGWMQRAEHLLESLPLSVEHAWIHVYSGLKALMADNDLDEAKRRHDLAKDAAGQLQNLDAQMMALALDGLILLREGKVPSAMLRMDEAMMAAVGGEMSDLRAIGNTCCFLIYACEAIADYDRATQWCAQTREFCRRMGMDAFFAICRNYYAAVLIWKGEWDEAERELSTALKHLPLTRPTYVAESLAKLGELRRRQGRIVEAEALFLQADPHRLSLMGRASIALDRGEPAVARDFLERQLRRVGAEDLAEQVFALSLMIRATILAGDVESAEVHLARMESVVSMTGTQPLRASANAAQGAVAKARGLLDKAKLHYEDAVDLFVLSDARFDAAQVRLALAEVLAELGRVPAATEHAVLALETFKRLGSALYVERAYAIVAKLSGGGARVASQVSRQFHLTPREIDVLGLIAAGKTNHEIAGILVLSVRTVERHISTIYEKLHVQGSSARASAAAIAVSFDQDT